MIFRRKPVQDRLAKVVIDRLRENTDLYDFEKPWRITSWQVDAHADDSRPRLVVEFLL